MRHSSLAALLIGSALLAAPALAEESLLVSLTAPRAAPNHWFGDISGGVRIQEIPQIDLFSDTTTETAVTSIDPELIMGGGSLTLGHVFGKQLDPQIWGGRAHVTLKTHYFVGSGNDDFSTDESVNFIGLDGTDYGIYEVVGSAHTRLQDWGAKLRGGLDFDQGGGWVLTPSIAFFGGHSRLSQTYDFYQDVVDYANRLTNDVRNTRLGTSFGLGATNDLGGGLTLLIGVEFGVDYNMTKANLINCLSYANPACSSDIQLYEEGSLEAQEFGFFANAAAGLGFDISFVHLAIEGQVGYDSYVPTIDYGNAPGEVTQIDSQGDLNFGGGITVTIPLN